jgi:hypothetical protein
MSICMRRFSMNIDMCATFITNISTRRTHRRASLIATGTHTRGRPKAIAWLARQDQEFESCLLSRRVRPQRGEALGVGQRLSPITAN